MVKLIVFEIWPLLTVENFLVIWTVIALFVTLGDMATAIAVLMQVVVFFLVVENLVKVLIGSQ